MNRIRQEESKEQREGRPWLPTEPDCCRDAGTCHNNANESWCNSRTNTAHLFSAAIPWQRWQICWQGPVLYFTSKSGQMQDQWEYRPRFCAGQKNVAEFCPNIAVKIGTFDAFSCDCAGCAELAWSRLQGRKLVPRKSPPNCRGADENGILAIRIVIFAKIETIGASR